MTLVLAELNAIASFDEQLLHCELLLRRRSVPRVAVLAWLVARIASGENIDFDHLSNVTPERRRRRKKNNFSFSVGVECIE